MITSIRRGNSCKAHLAQDLANVKHLLNGSKYCHYHEVLSACAFSPPAPCPPFLSSLWHTSTHPHTSIHTMVGLVAVMVLHFYDMVLKYCCGLAALGSKTGCKFYSEWPLRSQRYICTAELPASYLLSLSHMYEKSCYPIRNDSFDLVTLWTSPD